MAAPALAIGAAEEASGRSFEALSAKMNVHVPLPFILSLALGLARACPTPSEAHDTQCYYVLDLKP